MRGIDEENTAKMFPQPVMHWKRRDTDKGGGSSASGIDYDGHKSGFGRLAYGGACDEGVGGELGVIVEGDSDGDGNRGQGTGTGSYATTPSSVAPSFAVAPPGNRRKDSILIKASHQLSDTEHFEGSKATVKTMEVSAYRACPVMPVFIRP
jgi:hypothetical protein